MYKPKYRIKLAVIGYLLFHSSVVLATTISYHNLFSGKWIDSLIRQGIDEFSITFSYRITRQCELADPKVVSTEPEHVFNEIPPYYAAKALRRIVGPFESSGLKSSIELNDTEDLKDVNLNYISTIETHRYFRVNEENSQSIIKCLISDGKVVAIEMIVSSGSSSKQRDVLQANEVNLIVPRFVVVEYVFPE